jgi:predicted RNA-binding protein YlxR (DUF448 family)
MVLTKKVEAKVLTWSKSKRGLVAEPIRTCSACGEKRLKRDLYRFVWGEGLPLRDTEGRFNGRGAYCCRNEVCLGKLMSQKKKWKRIFRL